MTDFKNQILEISRQNQTGALSTWFNKQLDVFIEDGVYADEKSLIDVGNLIIKSLSDYREQAGVSTVVIGMSGGVDSALTASLFKKAGWRVIGYLMPINQDPTETERGKETCEALGIEYTIIPLDDTYRDMANVLAGVEAVKNDEHAHKFKVRGGNIRARLRMITLYNMASYYNGVVASTDNYSELATGFWTRYGDQGDIAPIQSLLKSWEVPMLAKIFGVPEKTWRAKPTDGLGIANGDEDQFGFTYLELDIMLMEIGYNMYNGLKDDEMQNMGGVNRENLLKVMNNLDGDRRAVEVFNKLLDRMGGSWFKRYGTINILYPFEGKHGNRYDRLNTLDKDLFYPTVLK